MAEGWTQLNKQIKLSVPLTWCTEDQSSVLFLSMTLCCRYLMFESLVSKRLFSNRYLLVFSSHSCWSANWPGRSLSTYAGWDWAFSIFFPDNTITIFSWGHRLAVVRFFETFTLNLIQPDPLAHPKLLLAFFMETWTRFWLLRLDGGVLMQ